MARARRRTSQWALPVRSVNAEGTHSTRAPRRNSCDRARGSAGRSRSRGRPGRRGRRRTIWSPGTTVFDSLRCSMPGRSMSNRWTLRYTRRSPHRDRAGPTCCGRGGRRGRARGGAEEQGDARPGGRGPPSDAPRGRRGPGARARSRPPSGGMRSSRAGRRKRRRAPPPPRRGSRRRTSCAPRRWWKSSARRPRGHGRSLRGPPAPRSSSAGPGAAGAGKRRATRKGRGRDGAHAPPGRRGRL